MIIVMDLIVASFDMEHSQIYAMPFWDQSMNNFLLL